MDEDAYNDYIYMIGELYVQRRLEQMRSAKLIQQISDLETQLEEKEGGKSD